MMKRIMVLAALVALGGYLCLAQAWANDDQKKTDTKSDKTTAEKKSTDTKSDKTTAENKPGKESGKTLSEKEFVVDAAKGNAMERQLGEMALRKTQNAGVRRFAQRLVRDHTQANEKLRPIWREMNVRPPRQMTTEDRKTVERFQALSGADFDRHFIHHMISDHEKDIKMYEDEAKNVKNGDLKNYVKNTLPTLREHLKMAQDLHKQMHSGSKSGGSEKTPANKETKSDKEKR